MKKYLAVYQTKDAVVSEEVFKAETRQNAVRLANFHKRHSPEITKHRYVRTLIYKIK